MSTRPLASILAALALAAAALAQSEPPAAAPAVTVAGSAPTESTATRDRDTLSVDFPDEDIRTILRNVADLFELNLVIPDTLTGKTSIKLRDVTWRQIFQVVLSPAGYTYIEEGNIVKVVSNESLTAEPVTTEVFIINNAKAVDLKPSIEGLIDTTLGGKILINDRSNALVITERPTRMSPIRQIIERLDKATAQVMIESQFVEVSDSDVRNIGVNWASLQGMTLGARNLGQTFNRQRGQTSSNSNNTEAGSASTYDVVPQTVNPNNGAFGSATLDLPSGTATIPSAQVPANVAGSNFTPQTIDADGVITPATFTAPITNTGVIENLSSLISTGSTNRVTSAVFSASDFNVIVSALKTLSDTKVVSNPTIVTLNNTEASINIGSEFPIPSYTYNSERGTFEVSGFQYKPIGVLLKVTPQVNAEGTIRMTLEPEISSSSRETTFGGAGGASIPIIDTRKVKTQISLKDGYTAGIGGLLTTSKNNGGTKVPVLGSIPGLGRLFSSKNISERTTNLLIFITAKTVNPDGAAPSEVFSQSMLDAVNRGKESMETKTK